MDSIDWLTAIQRKREQFVKGLGKARSLRHDRAEQALITLMDQLADFEAEYRRMQQQEVTEQEMYASLCCTIRRQWPELWADISGSLYANRPEMWLENPYIIIGVMVEHIPADECDQVSLESRINQLDALPLSHKANTLLDEVIEQLCLQLRQQLEDSRPNMAHWEYAACLYQLSKRFLALYNQVQVDAITAIRAAEEAGQMTGIVTNSQTEEQDESSSQ